MRKFTNTLFDLYVKQKIGLVESLLIMKNKPGSDRVGAAAAYVYEALKDGGLFSNALKSCPYIRFDDVYISFILLAEQNGDLRSAFSYLKEKIERDYENRQKIITASLYPAFVILVSVAASVFIVFYTNNGNWGSLLKYILLLIIFCTFIYILLFKILEGSRLSEAFIAVDFLVQNGFEVSAAVGCAGKISGPSSQIGKTFDNARLKLSYGMDLQTAFDFDKHSKIGEAFYYADVAGNQENIFGCVAKYLNEQSSRRREKCLLFIEPVFLLVAGVFLLQVLLTYFYPVIMGGYGL